MINKGKHLCIDCCTYIKDDNTCECNKNKKHKHKVIILGVTNAGNK